VHPRDHRDELDDRDAGRDADLDRRARAADTRDDDADARDEIADERERGDDVRERVLDRWERELTARAVSLDVLDGLVVERQHAERAARAEAHGRRRAAAEKRRDAAIDRAADRAAVTRREAPSLGDDHHATISALTGIGLLVVGDATPAAIMNAVVTTAVELAPSAGAATASLGIEQHLEAAAATSGTARQLDQAQLDAGRGPVVDAFDAGAVIVTADLADDDRWNLGLAVGEAGRCGAISAAVVLGDSAVGVLTLYANPGHDVDPASVTIAALLAGQASLAIQWSLDRRAAAAHNDALERALDSRDQIAQAKGILMEQRGLSADDAYTLLRTTSQSSNRKVLDVAAHVIAHRELPALPPARERR
jgi:hypothetical protein